MGNLDVELESSKNRVKTELNDIVSRGVFEQVMWERDVAIEQLKELGYGLGEKPKTGHWIKENPPMVERYPFCSECGLVNPFENALNYCPNCGAKMESEGENG